MRRWRSFLPAWLAWPGPRTLRHALAGVRAVTGPATGTAAMGLVAGVAMAQSGLPMAVLLPMSLLVYASSSQLACLPLMASQAPLWLVGATAAVLNLRFVVFSAEWSRYFHHLSRPQRVALSYFAGDPIYALFTQRHPLPGRNGRQRRREVAYYLGLALSNWAVWQLSSAVGLVLADQLPGANSLRFVAILALLTLTLPMVKDRPTRVAALAACAVALPAQALPRGLPVLVTMLAAMAAGLLAEHRPPRPHAG